MDLGTLKQQLTQGRYETFKSFTNDLELIWSNAIQYNGVSHPVSKTATNLREKSHRAMVEMFKDTTTTTTTSSSSSSTNDTKKGLPEIVIKRAKETLNGLIKSTPYAIGFNLPIESSLDSFELYKSKILQPTDLGKIMMKLNRNEYMNLDDFYDEVRLCFKNAIDYHGRHQLYGLQGRFLWNDFEWRIKELEYALTKPSNLPGKKGLSGKIPSLNLLRKTTIDTNAAATPATPAAGGAATAAPTAAAAIATDGSETPLGGETPLAIDTPMQIDGETPSSNAAAATANLTFPPSSTLTSEEHAKCVGVIDKLASDARFHLFVTPVDPSLYAGLTHYFDTITRPMDLKLIKRKLTIRAYSTINEFSRDVYQIRENVRLFYEEGNPAAIADAASIIEASKLLTSTFDELWKNWATLKGAKANKALQPSTPIAQTQSNLAPPTLLTQASIPAPTATPATTPAPTGAPPAVAPAPPAGGMVTLPDGRVMSAADYAAYRAEKKRRKAEKKEKKKRKREAAGFIDVAGDATAPNSPNSVPDTNLTLTVPKLEPQLAPPSSSVITVKREPSPQVHTALPSSTAPFSLPSAGPPSSSSSSAPSSATQLNLNNRSKIPKHSPPTSAATTTTTVTGSVFASPTSAMTPPSTSASTSNTIKLSHPTRISFVSGSTAPPKKVIPIKPITFAQRKKALEIARQKEMELGMPESFLPVPTSSTEGAGDEDVAMSDVQSSADSDRLPPSQPGSSSVISSSRPALHSSNLTSTSSSSLGFSKSSSALHRAHSHLATLIAVPERAAADGRRTKDKRARKKAEKWKANLERCIRAQKQLNQREEERIKQLGSEMLSEHDHADEFHLTPIRISHRDIPLYHAHHFASDAPHGTLVRVIRSTIPPSRLCPFAIDQHIILLARPHSNDNNNNDGDDDDVDASLSISFDLNDLSLEQHVQQHSHIFQTWMNLKTLTEEMRCEEQNIQSDQQRMRNPNLVRTTKKRNKQTYKKQLTHIHAVMAATFPTEIFF